MAKPSKLKDRQAIMRRDLATAALRVIARDGLDKASMRAIAHEMGRSTGVLTHYFRDRESLLLFTVEAVAEAVTVAIEELFVSHLTPETFSRAFEVLLDYDEHTDVYWRAWLALTTASMRGGAVHSAQAASYRAYREAIARRISALQKDGRFDSQIDPMDQAIKMIALVDGIGIQSIISPDVLTPARRSLLVRTYCETLFGKPLEQSSPDDLQRPRGAEAAALPL